MKKILLPLAALAILAAGCDTGTKDSYSTVNFYEYSLVTDKTNTETPAQVSATGYGVKLNWSKNTAELTTYDLTINNQKHSFETSPMPLNMGYLVQEGGSGMIDYGQFASTSNVATSGSVTNLSAGFGYVSYYYSGVYIPGIETATSTRMRLMIGYDYDDRYHVQSFWPECFYAGNTSTVSEGISHSATATLWRVNIDFTKNLAKCVIYNLQMKADDTTTPKAIVVDEIPVHFTNMDYYLQAAAPKTQVLTSKSELVSAEQYAADNEGRDYQASDFALYITSPDLTRASISVKIGGNQINFSGASTIQISSSGN